MASFELGVWHTRAKIRFEHAVKSGVDKDKAQMKWNSDSIYICALSTLVNWCVTKKIDVVFCSQEGGIYYPQHKRIKINGRLSPEKQVFLLLHECGHHLIGDKEKHERYGMGYSTVDPTTRRTFQHRCDIIDEEYEAWFRGFKLSQRLKLSIDKSKFDQTRSEMIKIYFRWALKPGQFKKHETVGDEDDDNVVIDVKLFEK